MKKTIIPLLICCFLGATSTFGQVNFKALYKKLAPIPHDSPLPLEEKVQIHQAFLAKAQNNDTLQFYGLLFLFHDYLRAADYTQATEYLVQAEGLAKTSGNIGWQGAASHQRAVLSIRLQNFEEARDYYKVAAKLCGEAGDSLCVAESLEQVSAMYAQLGEFKEAQRYFDIAMPLIEKYGSEEQKGAMLNNFGIMMSQQERPKEAIPYIKRGIAIYHKLGKHKEESKGLNNLADAYRRLQQYDLAIETYQRCIRINMEFNILENLLINYMGLYVLYDEQENFRAANEFLLKHYSLSDSLIGVETQKQIAELQAKYDSQQTELELQKSQAALLVAKRSLEHGVILLLFVLLLAAFGAWRWRVQQRLSKEEIAKNRENLSKLTQLLLEKNTLLTSLEEQLSERPERNGISPEPENFEENLYNQRILTEADWAAFKVYFEKAYPGYLLRLRNSFSTLSDAEERLFLFIKLNLTGKEIAAILGISASSVKKTRYRLRKRLELSEEADLEEYIHAF